MTGMLLAVSLDKLFRLTEISLELERDSPVEGDFWGETDTSPKQYGFAMSPTTGLRADCSR